MDKSDLDYLQAKAHAARSALQALDEALFDINSKLNELEENA